jgi:hypothetical protein
LHYYCRDDIEDEQYLFADVKLSEVEQRELRYWLRFELSSNFSFVTL